jgi:NarL family two-component system response regulator LiaR
MKPPITVAIVEDDKHYNNALKKIIEFDKDLVCVGQFFNGRDSLAKMVYLNPQVVLMDIKLPDESGVNLVQKLKSRMEDTHFIMCTSFEDDENIFEALKNGASGYLTKGESLDKIIAAIKECIVGGSPMSFGIAKRVIQYFREEPKRKTYLEELSKAENEVLDFLSQGLLYKEIAHLKNVSIDTIKKQAVNIYRKLQVSNKVEAINKLKFK